LDAHLAPVPALLPTYPPYPFAIVRGSGDRLWDDQGLEYLDLYGGHCVCATGHAHPRVIEAIARQAGALPFYSMAARVPVRDAAAAAIVRFSGMDSVFFCNSGAEANENALKVAAGLTGRSRFVAFRGSFHGRTLLAASVTDDAKQHAGIAPLLAEVEFLPFGEMTALARADLSGVAAVIVEPIQSMAGCRTANEAWFECLREVTAKAGALLIYDEIQTGMGRVGAPFAVQRYGVRPDLLTAAKGIASGVPMGALLMTAAVARQLKAGDIGSTFGGAPLAAAALLATLEVIEGEGLMARARAAAEALRRGLQGTVVRRVHGEGLLLGLDCGAHAKALKQRLLSERILVGGSNDPAVLRLMPPLNLSDASIAWFLDAVRAHSAELRAA
jgi:acetylornithine/succinyldiaminopimelate/putrescine aminotransferase